MKRACHRQIVGLLLPVCRWIAIVPIPLAPPVTTAVRPARSLNMGLEDRLDELVVRMEKARLAMEERPGDDAAVTKWSKTQPARLPASRQEDQRRLQKTRW